MMSRIFMGLGLLGSFSLILALLGYLSWDSSRGRELWVEVHGGSSSATELQPRLVELGYSSDRRPWMHVQVEREGSAVAVERHATPDPSRSDAIVVYAPRGLPRAHRSAEGPEPAFVLYRVSPGGIAYLKGIADEERALLE